MNLYFDTSFLAPLILQEATSAAVEEFIATLLPEQLCISQWTRVEFASLVAREVRMGSFRRDEALTAIVQFDDMVLRFWRVLVPTSRDYELAKHTLGSGLSFCPLRSISTRHFPAPDGGVKS